MDLNNPPGRRPPGRPDLNNPPEWRVYGQHARLVPQLAAGGIFMSWSARQRWLWVQWVWVDCDCYDFRPPVGFSLS